MNFYYCDCCDYKTSRKGSLTTHSKVQHQNIRQSCEKCSYKSGYKADVKEHFYRLHVDEELKIRCGTEFPDGGECNYRAGNWRILKKHQKIHGIKERFPCSQCPKNFASMYTRKQHDLAIHQGDRTPCKFCHKMFSCAQGAKQHEQSKHQAVITPCKICDKKFSNARGARRHYLQAHVLNP